MQYGLTCWALIVVLSLQTKLFFFPHLFFFVWYLKQILWNKIPNHVKLTCDSRQKKEIKKKRGNVVFSLPSTCSDFLFFKEFLFVAQIGYILYEIM